MELNFLGYSLFKLNGNEMFTVPVIELLGLSSSADHVSLRSSKGNWDWLCSWKTTYGDIRTITGLVIDKDFTRDNSCTAMAYSNEHGVCIIGFSKVVNENDDRGFNIGIAVYDIDDNIIKTDSSSTRRNDRNYPIFVKLADKSDGYYVLGYRDSEDSGGDVIGIPFDGSIYKPYNNDIFVLTKITDITVQENSELNSDIDNPYDQGGTSSPDGGGGLYGDGEDSEDIMDLLPDGSIEADSSNCGLFSRYIMSPASLISLGAALYTEGLFPTLGKELMTFMYNSPVEAVISLMSYPFIIGQFFSSVSTDIKFGSVELPVSGQRITGTSAQINWGTVFLEEYWGNFLDYAPHTKIDLYLPWGTGFVSIDPHECLPGSLTVVTNFEIAKGTCVHNVFGNKGALIGTYSGVCGTQLPITALDTSGKALSLVTSAVTAAVSAGSTAIGNHAANTAAADFGRHHTIDWSGALSARGVPGAIGPEAYTRGLESAQAAASSPYNAAASRQAKIAASSAVAALRTPPHISRNGSFTGNGSGMSMQFPYVIVSRPEQNIPENYGYHYGYPSNIYASLGSLRGYTEVASVHLDGIVATEKELSEIDTLLKGGVIL